MACIVKLPDKDSKGVLVFTDLERDQFIVKDKILQEKIIALKNKWVIGMHHNWIRFEPSLENIFDFAMYLPAYTGRLPLVPLAAINFTPEFFKPTNQEKFWDILFVARAVKFKNVPDFLQVIRALYDSGKMYRVLFICPIPPYKWSDRKSTFRNIRAVYDKMFSEKEQDLFTLLSTDYREPFPFDAETVAHFYRSSRVFVHTSNKERQGRVMGNAWASGMPMVGLSHIGTPLPQESKKKPFFYEAKSYAEFPTLLSEAVEAERSGETKKADWSKVVNLFQESESKKRLISELKQIFESQKLKFGSGEEFLHNLGLRIARHHKIEKGNLNVVMMPIEKLTELLNENLDKIIGKEDPEVALAELFPTKVKRFNFFLN